MSWQGKFLEAIGPGLLPGVTVSKWMSILQKAKYKVGVRHWPRAVFISCASLLNSIGARVEKLIHQRRILRQQVSQPVFILGSWRSGTTYLQNLLSNDSRFGYPNLYQTLFPSHFLYTEPLLSKLFDMLVPQTRPQDNVNLSMKFPSEEEIAMCAYSGASHLIGDTMTMNVAGRYQPYITLQELPESEQEKWKKDYLYFIRKLAVRHQKPLMLKSPANTGRISTLLELFPDAKFISVHRHPYDVVRSGIGWLKNTRRYWGLQGSSNTDIQSIFLDNYGLVMNAYFEQRDLIPRDNLVEIRFEHLEKNPLIQLEGIYNALDLPDFESARPEFVEYLNGIKNYNKNKFKVLEPALKKRVEEVCPSAFEEWHYGVDTRTSTLPRRIAA